MQEIYEPNPEDCEYCEISYYEHDTGYTEYNCKMMEDDNYDCCGGDLKYGCPLAFKYEIEK